LFGALIAGGIVGLVIVVALIALSIFASYLLIKIAVRNGVLEALKRSGLDSGGPGFVHGYPPDTRGAGAPPAPSYRGPYGQ
jgi:uncharacterized membrane protein YqiK